MQAPVRRPDLHRTCLRHLRCADTRSRATHPGQKAQAGTARPFGPAKCGPLLGSLDPAPEMQTSM